MVKLTFPILTDRNYETGASRMLRCGIVQYSSHYPNVKRLLMGKYIGFDVDDKKKVGLFFNS